MSGSKHEIRLAMIGCGRRAPAYPATVKAVPGCRLVALCDRVLPRVRLIKDLAEDERIREYTDHREMLADGGFDAVFVVTEPEYQAGLSVECMQAGYHAYSDVPVSYRLEDCWNLVTTVERTGRIYYLGEQLRHAMLFRLWKRWVAEGRLGSVLFAEGHYIHAMAGDRFWRHSETGELLTWEEAGKVEKKVKTRQWTMPHVILYGPHELSPLLKVLDDRVVRVSCFSTGGPNKRLQEIPFPCQNEVYPRADMEVALMHTAKGAILRFAANFTTPVSQPHWYHLLGTKGEVETRRGNGEAGYAHFHPEPIMGDTVYRVPRTRYDWFHLDAEPPDDIVAELGAQLSEAARKTGHGGTDYYPVADFIDAIRDGKAPDIDVYRAVETAAPCIVAAQSAEQDGRMLDVPDFRPGPERKAGQPRP